ncbi:MAG: tetratricopeptide repeat protein [Rhodocyclaceae bacterium]
MSLINQMLKDLDTRRAAGAERSDLPAEVRFLPTEGRSRWPGFAAAVLALVALTALALWWLRIPAPEPAAPRATRAVAPPAQIATAPAADRGSGIGSQESGAGASAEAAALDPKPAARNRDPAGSNPQPETGIARREPSKPQAETPAAKPETANPKPETATPKAETANPKPETAVAPPRIEKRLREPTAHERAEQRLAQAVGLLNQGRSAEALAALRAALDAEPAHTRARLTLAGLLVEERKLEEAKSVLGAGLALDAAQPALAFPMARIQVESGDLAGAERTLAAAGSGAGAEQRAFHAGVLQRLARHREAIGEYRQALGLAPRSGVWWMGLAISLEAEGENAQAREAYERAKASGSLTAELGGFVDAKLRALR